MRRAVDVSGTAVIWKGPEKSNVSDTLLIVVNAENLKSVSPEGRRGVAMKVIGPLSESVFPLRIGRLECA